MQHVEPIARLVSALTRLPGIGEKTASRLALFILNSDKDYVAELSASLLSVKSDVKLCGSCMAFSDRDPCSLCSDHSRDSSKICVVADFKDLVAIDSAGGYRGLYHVLHGTLAPLKGVGPDDIRISELLDRIKSDEAGTIEEIIVATGFDVEGEATSAFLLKVLRPLGRKLSRIASGVPMGGFIEYLDPTTLERAISGRRELI